MKIYHVPEGSRHTHEGVTYWGPCDIELPDTAATVLNHIAAKEREEFVASVTFEGSDEFVAHVTFEGSDE